MKVKGRWLGIWKGKEGENIGKGKETENMVNMHYLLAGNVIM